MPELNQWIPQDILDKFETHNYNHAAEILSQSFPSEFGELLSTLRELNITLDDIRASGGSESSIPPKFSVVLEPLGWKEIRISGDLNIKFYPRSGSKRGIFSDDPNSQITIENYIDGHNIDYLKGRIAIDVEWNSKDQTFDRDLFAMRTYYECNIISVGIIITRSEELNDIFRRVMIHDERKKKWTPVIQKYGASTTWMGKLIPRLDSRRHGGCPILALGIKKTCVTDWKEDYHDEHAE
ncbi:MAG: BglII/BstYI family type II restriction endonuclease [Anaerofustis sp.]